MFIQMWRGSDVLTESLLQWANIEIECFPVSNFLEHSTPKMHAFLHDLLLAILWVSWSFLRWLLTVIQFMILYTHYA